MESKILTSKETLMEINYVLTYEDLRNDTFSQLYQKLFVILFGLIPLVGLIVFEIVFIILGIKNGFTEIYIMNMIIFPSIFVILATHLPIGIIIIEKIRWHSTSKIPLERKWILNDDGLIIDEIYQKKKYSWEQITRVSNDLRSSIWFIFGNMLIGTLPKRVLDDEQMERLYIILSSKLASEKIKYFKIKENKTKY